MADQPSRENRPDFSEFTEAERAAWMTGFTEARNVLEARLHAAEEALRDIRWMHQEDNVSYRHLFLKAQARAAVFLDMGDNTPPEETA